MSGCDSGFGQALARHLDHIGAEVFAGCLCTSSPGAKELLSSCSEKYDSVIPVDVDVSDKVATLLIKTKQEGQHPLTGQRASNFRRDLGAT